MKIDRAEIKFQLHEGREKQSLLEKYLNHDSEVSYQQAFINPYTGENMESKLAGSLRDKDSSTKQEKFNSVVFEKDSYYNSQEDITNLSEIIKLKRPGKAQRISETNE